MGEPFFYRGGWYVWYRDNTGKRKRKLLSKNKREAWTLWKASIRSGTQMLLGDPTFSRVAAEWLLVQGKRHQANLVSRAWLNRVSRTVKKFTQKYPSITCSQITPAIATGWLGADSSQAYERTEASTLKQILSWAEGSHIDKSPLAGLRLEKGARREIVISIEDHRKLCRADPLARFRMLLWFCWWTGARPIEMRELEWSQIAADCATAILRKHKTAKKKNRPRVIYFNGFAQTILRRHKQAIGPVFVNSRGERWTKDALCRRLKNLGQRVSVDVSAYAYRHSYITRALLNGIDPATVAELTGTSVEMISRNYGHLDKAKEHLAKAACLL